MIEKWECFTKITRRARTLIRMYEEEGISKDRILIKVRVSGFFDV